LAANESILSANNILIDFDKIPNNASMMNRLYRKNSPPKQKNAVLDAS